ncbi:hypothetical protein [Aliikangiella maris]|uniref:Uncharacterized protein n=2 Tax=Aliikangiella maris TaxID=3162458 RepID=A0ABV2BNT5_9GAMM
MIKDLFEQIKQKLTPQSNQSYATDTHTTNQEATSPIGQLTTDKIKAIVAELTQAGPLFAQAGFTMEQLEIEIGLLPKVLPQFVQIKEIPISEESVFLNQLKDQKLLQFVLHSLFKASRMKSLLENTNLSLYGIEISVSAPPSVKTIFKREIPLSNADIVNL